MADFAARLRAELEKLGQLTGMQSSGAMGAMNPMSQGQVGGRQPNTLTRTLAGTSTSPSSRLPGLTSTPSIGAGTAMPKAPSG